MVLSSMGFGMTLFVIILYVLLYILFIPAFIMVISPRMFLRIIRMKKEYNSIIRNSIRVLGVILITVLLLILL